MNEAIYGNFKGVQTIAEESSTYDGVTRPSLRWWLRFWNEMDDGLDERHLKILQT